MGLTQRLGTIPLAIQTDSSNNVGIGGAANASYKLAVTGASLFSGGLTAGATIQSNDQTSYILYNSTAGTDAKYWAFQNLNSSGTFRLRAINDAISNGINAIEISRTGISSVTTAFMGGNVGIGTISPTGTYGKLSVAGGISILDDNNAKLEIGRYSSGAANSYIKIGTNSASLRITNAADSADLVTFTNSGNVGIGIVPQSWFSSYKALQIGASMSFMQDGSTTSSYYGGNLYVGTDGNFKYTINGSSGLFGIEGGALVFYTAPSGTAGNTATITERFNISNNGRVNIYSSQTYCLNVTHTNNASGIGTFVTSMGSNAANTSSYHYIATTGGADRFYVYGNGNVVNTNNSYGPLSDIKLKENITDATPKLDKLMQVRIVNYNLKSDLGYETNKQIGVIAQELEQIFPSLVDEHIDRDSEGNDLETTTKSVKMSVFVPILIKAIQELNAKVTALENK